MTESDFMRYAKYWFKHLSGLGYAVEYQEVYNELWLVKEQAMRKFITNAGTKQKTYLYSVFTNHVRAWKRRMKYNYVEVNCDYVEYLGETTDPCVLLDYIGVFSDTELKLLETMVSEGFEDNLSQQPKRNLKAALMDKANMRYRAVRSGIENIRFALRQELN